MSFILVQEPPAWALPDNKPASTPIAAEPIRSAVAEQPVVATPPPVAQPPTQPAQQLAPAKPASALQSRIRIRERRWSERIAMTRTGRLSLGESGISVACQVLDISRFGAMLEVDEASLANSNFDLPHCFLLTFTSGRIRSEADCIIRWRGDGRIGVNFIGNVRTFVATQTN